MNAVSVSASSTANNPYADMQSLALQLDTLRQLLLNAVQAIFTSDAPQVQTACEELTALAANLRPAWGELFPNQNNMTAMEAEQKRQLLLRPLFDARALYLASMRRWRRSLRLRRSLLEMQMEAPAYGGDELSRWG
jgi:hypothetical protein